MDAHLFLDIQAIQAVPPCNINRDDAGSPKTAQYGGVTRARVSSQCWKHSMREYFKEHSGDSNVGIRSKNIVKYVADKIVALKPELSEQEALDLANKTLNNAGVKTKKDNDEIVPTAKALFFLGETQANSLAQAAINNVTDKKQLQEIFKDNPPIDIALFGRMLADDPSLNEDASSQVAHAISTHAVRAEFDYYTAVDDLSTEDNAGAGMLGTIEFNSSTLYRYANVAVHEFSHQLSDNKESTINALRLFIEAFANAMPTGKANTFANQTLPQMLVVTLRDDRPVNLVSAFEDPVKAKDGYVSKSIEKLSQEYEKVQKFVNKPLASFYVTMDSSNENLKLGVEEQSMQQLLDDFSSKVSEFLQ